MKHRIQAVRKGSIGDELNIRPGDYLLAIGGREVEDIFDYEFLCREEYLELLVESAEGEAVLFEIEKDEDEDLGLDFGTGLMDEYRSCRNKCIFCFIDQMPPGMRETLYFKDDDARLSFLQGNYVTLTNLNDHDVERIIQYHLSPINISVHTTDPELRCKMLNNRFAGRSLQILDKLADHHITMNGQIVLCPGYNDGAQLDKTIADLSRYLPHMESLSVVPVGLTKYREGLAPLRLLTPEEARETINLIEQWQQKLFPEHGLHFVHASDEIYLKAGLPLPEEERYDGYLQLENGVGMLRLFMNQFREELTGIEAKPQARQISLAGGVLAAPVLQNLLEEFMASFPGIKVRHFPIINHFFGESITVAGLVTGRDLIDQLKGQDLGEILYIPDTMLRMGEEVFLDDISLSQVRDQLDLPVIPLSCDGAGLVRELAGLECKNSSQKLFRPYEPGGKNE